ncbi:MAG: hypothetical protein GX915_03230 [Clostridiales bacterium]|nr:hypothetical protein [Clostridiales bacterium]
MNFNMITSELNFQGCTIRKLKVDNSIISISSDIVRKIGLEIVPFEINMDQEKKYGKLLMKIVVELEENLKNVANIELVIEGAFSVPSSVDESTFKELILINGAASLYSIARSKIENISATTFLEGKIIIPMINIYDYYKEKKKEIEDTKIK